MQLQFGDFVLDDEARQLIGKAGPVHLSPKAFDLLAVLIHERPRALSKEDLHARLWPDVFVSDGSLAMAVAEVRAALGESAKDPHAIRTVHRHGYAFQAEAFEAPGSGPAAPTSAEGSIGHWLMMGERRIALATGENIVGREPLVRVWIDSPAVSRRHARLRIGVNGATIEDLKSKNGTFLDGKRLSRIEVITDGSELRFGSVSATFRAWAVEPTHTEGDAS